MNLLTRRGQWRWNKLNKLTKMPQHLGNTRAAAVFSLLINSCQMIQE